MSLKRFGVSLEDKLLEELDQYVEANGFTNRSQAIRFLVEKNITEQKWQCNHVVAGTIIIMYDQTRKDIATKITDIQQAADRAFRQVDGHQRHPAWQTGHEPSGLIF